MLRRIVSLGQQASESDEPMSPSSEDAGHSPDTARSTGGLASVFKGLTGAGSRLVRSPPPPSQTTFAAVVAPPAAGFPAKPLLHRIDASSSSPSVSGLPPQHMAAFVMLRDGTSAERISAAASLRIAIATYPLSSVLDIWYAGKDLIEIGKSVAERAAGWELVSECVRHKESTDLERREYFQTLSIPASPEDFHLQLAALVDLAGRGRELSGFEYEVIPLLTTWLRETYKSVKTARRQASRNGGRSRGKATASGEEKNLSQLFAFLLDVIKFNSKVIDDRSAGDLINCLLDICMSTSMEEDLKVCIVTLNAIVTFGAIPADHLPRCVKVLSSIYSMVPNLEKSAWHTLSDFFKSHHGQVTVEILLDVLRRYPDGVDDKESHREVRGALAVLQKLVWKTSVKGYPAVPLNPLIDGLANVAASSPTPRICVMLLRLVNSLFDDGDSKLNSVIMEEDWAGIFELAVDCLRKTGTASKSDLKSQSSSSSLTRVVSTPKREDSDRPDPLAQELNRLVTRLEQLLSQRRSDFMQRQDCIVFFTKIHEQLPDSAVGLVMDYFNEFHCCFPSDLQWEDNLRLVLYSFYMNPKRSSLVRTQALKSITDVIDLLELIDDDTYEYSSLGLIHQILDCLEDETDILVLQEAVAFAVSLSTTADPELFDYIVSSFRKVVAGDRLRSPMSSPPGPAGLLSMTSRERLVQQPGEQRHSVSSSVVTQSLSNVITRGYVQIFMNTMNSDCWKAAKIFDALIHIARSRQCDIDARLSAMKMLFRLRADWEDRVFLTTDNEPESLAATLYRTEESLARKLAEDAQHTRPSATRQSRAISFGQSPVQPPERAHLTRSTSGASSSSAARRHRQLWSFPDPDALPQEPSTTSSPVLFSDAPLSPASCSTAENGDGDDDQRATEMAGGQVLNMATWLETLIGILHGGCDWEIYSFIIVHLPSQLGNHGIFRGAIPQMQQIRGILCELIHNNQFQEPPSSTGLRKSQVAVCFYHILTTIMSYHRHFSKSEEDEIVVTFVRGLSDKSARCCVHALSICCYEMPLSVSKILVAILQRMGQIISQQGLAIHILEFLASLSRLPALYSNFREEEYRIVFGICFRYLSDVKMQKARQAQQQQQQQHQQSRTGSVASDIPAPIIEGFPARTPTQTDDLPQYVYALAYHVVTFWFLALKLPDRANFVGWIAKSLFQDLDGSGPSSLLNSSDEQSQITMDFMQRVAFTDADDSAEDPLFTKERFGEIKERRWIIGNSIVSIKQATRTGWCQIVKRQPSGTSCFVVRESLQPPPAHQSRVFSSAMDFTGNNGGGAGQGAGDGGAALSTLSGVVATPSHVLLQLLSSIPQATDPALRPIILPEEDFVERSIRMLDRSLTVDGHKVGVIYIGEGQTQEAEILSNVSGSRDYVDFLNGLGTLTRLKGAKFNTQGLDREYDTDGQFTFCWRDRVTEMVFHVITQMPTNREHDPLGINKKRHIGNDFVNIIFNDSGLPFRFDTFPSDFNYVNIVITPVTRVSFVATRERYRQQQQASEATEEGGAPLAPTNLDDQPTSFFKVHVMSKPGFPEISPAADPKMLSLQALPDFIRLLALNASVFSHVWSNRAIGEHISSWRNRLREIKRLRERYGAPPAGSSKPATPAPAQNAVGSPMPPNSLAPSVSAGGPLGITGVGSSNASTATVTAQQYMQNHAAMSSSTSLPFSPSGSTPTVADANNSGAMGSSSRPASSMRDSFSSLRRSSVATFFTTASETTTNNPGQSHRSSMLSTATTEATDVMGNSPSSGGGGGGANGNTVTLDSLVESLDFAKWT